MIDRLKLELMIRRRQPSGRVRKRRGQAIIEMAIVMVLLLILSFGMADFGLYLTGYIRATNCAREVARQAVVRNSAAATVCGNDQLTPLFVSAGTAFNPPDYMNASSGTPLTVTIEAKYRWKAIGPLLNAFFPGTVWPAETTTTSKATMRMEGRKP